MHPRALFLLGFVVTAACSSEATISQTGADAAPEIDADVAEASPDAEADVDVDADAGVEASAPDGATDAPEAETDAAVTTFGEPCGEWSATSSVFLPGLQYSGSVSWTRTTSEGEERVSVSAPIHPSTDKLYEGEGSFYPATTDLRVSLAKHSALTYCFLLGECSKTDPTIKTKPPVSSEEIAHDYDAVASCAYANYTAKPYWIPQLLLDVDVCSLMLGSGWHMPTEDEVKSFTSTELDFLSTTLDAKDGNTYFSLDLWVRGADGTIQVGHLAPGAPTRLSPLGVSGDALKVHYEGGVGLRCIKRK